MDGKQDKDCRGFKEWRLQQLKCLWVGMQLLPGLLYWRGLEQSSAAKDLRQPCLVGASDDGALHLPRKERRLGTHFNPENPSFA